MCSIPDGRAATLRDVKLYDPCAGLSIGCSCSRPVMNSVRTFGRSCGADGQSDKDRVCDAPEQDVGQEGMKRRQLQNNQAAREKRERKKRKRERYRERGEGRRERRDLREEKKEREREEEEEKERNCGPHCSGLLQPAAVCYWTDLQRQRPSEPAEAAVCNWTDLHLQKQPSATSTDLPRPQQPSATGLTCSGSSRLHLQKQPSATGLTCSGSSRLYLQKQPSATGLTYTCRSSRLQRALTCRGRSSRLLLD
ncbi:hypothetical protein F2P81_025414 [Scophthalmus maximus]|uniref:BZIP domain-containing protein n=1 Tax=Scophthalmus maximus TaxID=52904 RepID=A0A6A4RQH7_SCOMX|nr:hypothetical protein F2P81_025414 [Scophthalmus maximus]